MTLRTALVIGGDTREARREVEALTDDVQALGTASERAAGPARQLTAAEAGLARAAAGAIAPVANLDAAQNRAAASARGMAVAQGSIAPAVGKTAGAYGGLVIEMTQALSVQNILKQGSSLLAGVLTGALTGGIAGVAAAAGAAALSYLGMADASEEAEDAAAGLGKTVSDIGHFFDETTGKIKQASAAAREFAILTRQQEIQSLQKRQATALRTAAGAVRESAEDQTIAVKPTGGRGGGAIRVAGSRAISDAVGAGDLAALRRLAAGNDRQAELASTVLKSFAAKDNDQARIEALRLEALSLATGKLVTAKDAAGRATARNTEEMTRSSGAAGRSTAAHVSNTAAARAQATATGAAAAAQRELASDLAGVIGRYDPARKASMEYAEELAKIGRLEASFAKGGIGLAAGEASRYRVDALAGFIKTQLPDANAAKAAAGAIDQVRVSTNGMADAAREASEAQRQLLDNARGALDAIIVGGEKAGDVVDRLAKSLASAALEAAVFGTGPLASVLTGTIGGASSKKVGNPFSAGVNAAADAAGLNKAVEKGTSSALDRVFGTGGKFTSTLKNAGYGSIAGSLSGGSAGGGALGGAIGGAVASKFLSSALGSFAGPLGSVLGGVLGGAIGGLFGPKAKPGGVTVSSVGGSAAIGGNVGSDKQGIQVGSGLGGSVASSLNAIAAQLNGSIGQFSVQIGKYKDDLRVNVNGRPLGGVKGSGATGFGSDEAAAVNFAVTQALAQGGIQGVSDAVAKAIRSNPNVEVALQEALKVQQLETLLGGIASEAQRAFSDFEKVAKDRVRIAQTYGFDVVAIEKRNADDRTKIAADLAKVQTGSLQQLLDEMQRGSLFEGSSIDRIAALNTAIAKAQTDLDAGVEGAGDTLAKLLQDRLGALKDAYGTTGGYATGRAETESQARAAIAAANARIADAQAKSDPALKQTNAALDENNAQNSEMLAALKANNDLLVRIAAADGDGGISSYFTSLTYRGAQY